MAGRNEARRSVLQMLYLVDQNPDADVHWIRTSMEEQLGEDDIFGFGWSLFAGIREQQTDLDEQISAAASNWKKRSTPQQPPQPMISELESLHALTQTYLHG